MPCRGRDTSDVEINIKIALSEPVRDGRLTEDARNALLVAMTDEVAALVLRNNYLQTLALSLAQRRALEDFGFQQRLIQTLEARGLFDRAVEVLPDDKDIAERVRRAPNPVCRGLQNAHFFEPSPTKTVSQNQPLETAASKPVETPKSVSGDWLPTAKIARNRAFPGCRRTVSGRPDWVPSLGWLKMWAA